MMITYKGGDFYQFSVLFYRVLDISFPQKARPKIGRVLKSFRFFDGVAAPALAESTDDGSEGPQEGQAVAQLLVTLHGKYAQDKSCKTGNIVQLVFRAAIRG